MTKKETKMAEELHNITMVSEKDSGFISNRLLHDDDLDEEQHQRLLDIYDREIGYGFECPGS